VGSLLTHKLAYIAGFLDGDGSLMLQIKKRSDSKTRWRFMSTICFYQDSRHAADLVWIRETLGIGYVSHRKDGISELRINGFAQTEAILKKLIPYLRFKKHQAHALYKAVCLLNQKSARVILTGKDLRKVISNIVTIQAHNYVTKHKKTETELLDMVGLTP